MSTERDPKANPEVSEMQGAAALPRLNGELVFEEPWEGRAFGIAVALNNRRVYPWRDFREHLVTQISSDENQGIEGRYYDQWLRAMEALLLEQGLVSPDELEQRTVEYVTGQREDHDHDDYEGHHH